MTITPILSVIIFIIILNIFYVKIANSKLKNWIINNGYILVKKEIKYFNRGPFFSTNMQIIYKTILIKNGIQNEYWIKVGHPLFGVFINEINVHKNY
jgi:hypothetical protein